MSSLRLPRILGITPCLWTNSVPAVLVQYRSGLYFCFLGWLTTRIGLKPLREMTSLASSMTVHSPDQRLNPDLAPPEISETMQEFNNMFDRPEGIPETVRFLV